MRASKPYKGRDQFFLKNRLILQKEVQLADLKSDDKVLEIGAGTGNLTEVIAEKAYVVAIEKDRRFVPYLKGIGNTEVLCGDALRILQDKRLGRNDIKFNKVISNIPYSLSKRILIELLRHEWEVAVLVVQKEFAQKLEKEKFGILMDECCNFSVVGDISPAEFYPPAVVSSLIILKQKKTLQNGFLEFLDSIFRQKNKDVRNVVEKCPKELARKKIRHLKHEEIKKLML